MIAARPFAHTYSFAVPLFVPRSSRNFDPLVRELYASGFASPRRAVAAPGPLPLARRATIPICISRSQTWLCLCLRGLHATSGTRARACLGRLPTPSSVWWRKAGGCVRQLHAHTNLQTDHGGHPPPASSSNLKRSCYATPFFRESCFQLMFAALPLAIATRRCWRRAGRRARSPANPRAHAGVRSAGRRRWHG